MSLDKALREVVDYLNDEPEAHRDILERIMRYMKKDQTDSVDPLYFTPGEFFKGIRLLYNKMDFKMFYGKFFANSHHTEEYVMSHWQKFGQSPFKFWCSLDEEKRKTLEFLVYECARKEAQREGAVA